MKIEKTYIKGYDDNILHFKVRFKIKDGERYIGYVFTRIDEESCFNFLDLLDKKYLDDNKIEYIIETVNNKNRIIPIGLVKFNNNIDVFGLDGKYIHNNLNLIVRYDDEKLHLYNEVIENVERAIQIKYEAYKFVKKFDLNNYIEVIEEKELI